MIIDYETKYQACNLSDALHRNINDNFKSVSFKITENKELQVKIVLIERTKAEEEYIDDVLAEFDALQDADIVREVIITTIQNDNSPLDVIVYQKA